jgi:hypothetical protein
MLYNTLIKTIERFAITNPQDKGSVLVSALATNNKQSIGDFLLHIDIRQVGSLRNVIPNAFPKPLRGCCLRVDQNIHGAWRVIPVEKHGTTFREREIA